MADVKITALTAISANPVNPATFPIPMVDLLDNTITASGTTKKVTVNQILGAGGTATLASATITGNLTVDTSTFFVDSSADKVGIGTTTLSSEKLTVAGNLSANAWLGRSNIAVPTGDCSIFRSADNTLGFGIASSTAMTLNSTGLSVSTGTTNPLDLTNAAVTTERQIKITNSTVTAFLGVEPAAGGRFLGSAANNAYFGTNSAYGLEFATNNNVRMTLNTTGNLAFANGLGIDFADTASGSGTMTSELLNDYEEGTWVPVIADATTGGNVGTVTINSATYTKIGRQVSIQCDLRSITTTGMTGANNLFIRGLPFTSVKGGNGSFYTYRIGRNASTVSSAVTIEHNVSLLYLSLFTASSANTNLSILVSDITSGTSELALSVTYTV